MEKIIDCLLIGHNEVNLEQYENSIRAMGTNSGAYRDLNLNFVRYNNRPYSAAEIFNLFNYRSGYSQSGFTDSYQPLSSCETFSAAVAYLGTYLHRRGFTFDYVNSFQDEKEELAQKLTGGNIRTIAIITTLYVWVLPILEIIEFVKKYNQTARIIIGGPFILTQCCNLQAGELEYLFNTTIGADIYVNSSQGEATLVKIIQSLRDNRPFDRIPNIYFKTEKGYVSTPIIRENNNMSENMVNWSLFSDRVSHMVNTRTSRSCPFSCAFCGFPERAGKYQMIEVEKIEEELNALSRIEKVKQISFIDDTFNVPRERFKKILEMIIKNRYPFKWHSNFRCQFADREIIELMKQSGCEGVFLGIESGSDKILTNMNKAASVEKYIRGIELLREYEIVTMGSFILGFPGETDETARETFEFIRESGIDFFQFQQWYCEPITPIYREKDKYRLSGESFEWRHATMDSTGAADWVEKIFFSINRPVWIPQYGFSFDNFWHLHLRGLDLEQVKQFLRSFCQAIKEKLKNPMAAELSYEMIKKLKQSCGIESEEDELYEKKCIAANKERVKFNF